MTDSIQIGPYQVLSKLGAGGMAVVYHAIDSEKAENAPEREVALKILMPQYYTDVAFLRRFAKEGLNARRLKHPNIVRTYATGFDDGYHYLSMQFIEGSTLEQYVEGRGPLTVAETASILGSIGEALDYAHELGYVHRDLKLNNIMRSHDGHCLLTDFGVSKHLSTDMSMMTGVGQSIGTPSYMSPEQARGEQVADGKSDIYSMGVIAYRLLTGRLPFVAEDIFELTHKIICDAPIDPRQFNPGLDAAATTALMRALAKDPAERPDSCAAFVDGLLGVESTWGNPGTINLIWRNLIKGNLHTGLLADWLNALLNMPLSALVNPLGRLLGTPLGKGNFVSQIVNGLARLQARRGFDSTDQFWHEPEEGTLESRRVLQTIHMLPELHQRGATEQRGQSKKPALGKRPVQNPLLTRQPTPPPYNQADVHAHRSHRYGANQPASIEPSSNEQTFGGESPELTQPVDVYARRPNAPVLLKSITAQPQLPAHLRAENKK